MRARRLLGRTSARWALYALIGDNERCEAQEFIESLRPGDSKRLLAILERTCNDGPPKNVERFAKLEGDIFEFKSYQDRLPCFYRPGYVIVITHGFKKKRDRTPPKEIARAQRAREEFISGEHYE
jgi:phage-related protein